MPHATPARAAPTHAAAAAGPVDGGGVLHGEGGGSVFELPVPRGLNERAMRAILQARILPRLAAHAPAVMVVPAGADALEEALLSRLALSRNAARKVLAATRPPSSRPTVPGGGCNPSAAARARTGLRALGSDGRSPGRPPGAARAILRALPPWVGAARRPPPGRPEVMHSEPPREGPVRAGTGDRLAGLSRR